LKLAPSATREDTIHASESTGDSLGLHPLDLVTIVSEWTRNRPSIEAGASALAEAPDTPVGGTEAAAVQAGWRAALANVDAAAPRAPRRPVSGARSLRALTLLSSIPGVVAVAVADVDTGALQGLVSDDPRLDLGSLAQRLAPRLAESEPGDDLVMDVRGGSVVVRPVRSTSVFLVAVLGRAARRANVRSRMRSVEVELAGFVPRLGSLATAR